MQTPGDLAKKIFNDASSWLLAAIVGYATLQFVLAMMDYMSKDMQKHAAGKDHAVRACIGLVGAFSAATIMAYLKNQSGTWGIDSVASAGIFLSYLR